MERLQTSYVCSSNGSRESFTANLLQNSGVARVFPGGRIAHPEDQIQEENDEKLRKMVENKRRMRECSSFAHPMLRVWLHPCSKSWLSDRVFYVTITHTITDADFVILKSLHTLFDKYLDHMQVKFEQNHLNYTKFWAFSQKWLIIFDKVSTPFWETFLWLKQLFDAKLLI